MKARPSRNVLRDIDNRRRRDTGMRISVLRRWCRIQNLNARPPRLQIRSGEKREDDQHQRAVVDACFDLRLVEIGSITAGVTGSARVRPCRSATAAGKAAAGTPPSSETTA